MSNTSTHASGSDNATNRRIIASLHVLGASANDDTIINSVDFTAAVLSLSYDDFQVLAKDEFSSDFLELLAQLGAMVHDSPRSEPSGIELVEAISEYFGVENVADVTLEAFETARKIAEGDALEEVTVLVTVALRIRKPKSLSVDDVTSDMDYSFTSQTLGAVILDTEVRDVE